MNLLAIKKKANKKSKKNKKKSTNLLEMKKKSKKQNKKKIIPNNEEKEQQDSPKKTIKKMKNSELDDIFSKDDDEEIELHTKSRKKTKIKECVMSSFDLPQNEPEKISVDDFVGRLTSRCNSVNNNTLNTDSLSNNSFLEENINLEEVSQFEDALIIDENSIGVGTEESFSSMEDEGITSSSSEESESLQKQQLLEEEEIKYNEQREKKKFLMEIKQDSENSDNNNSENTSILGDESNQSILQAVKKNQSAIKINKNNGLRSSSGGTRGFFPGSWLEESLSNDSNSFRNRNPEKLKQMATKFNPHGISNRVGFSSTSNDSFSVDKENSPQISGKKRSLPSSFQGLPASKKHNFSNLYDQLSTNNFSDK